MFGQVDAVIKSFRKVDEDFLEELEEILICSDVGAETTEYIIDELRDRVKAGKLREADEVKGALGEILRELVGEGEPLKLDTHPSVILVIGVNGVGKTTSIGKISANLKSQGKKVVVAAADTFRAAAIDQLAIRADRCGVDMIRQGEGSDPAAVLFDACKAAKARNTDVLICDTAGRLHNKKNLMDELAKMARVVDREMPDVRHETFLVLDSTTGQNAVNQARAFSEVANITGIILTKLDGSSKGGIIVSICHELKIPVRLVGVGEGIDDMQPFSAEDYVKALFE